MGHDLCCDALKSLAASIRPKDSESTSQVRSSAEFLLRAFAAKRMAASTANVPGAESATHGYDFDAAFAQCRDDPRTTQGYVNREKDREKAVALATLHSGKLMRKRHSEAMSLLRSEPCNSYNLRDDLGESHGWAMYPLASRVNHSCLPNTACVADGQFLVFEALRPILVGEEVLQCYLFLGEAEAAMDAAFSAAVDASDASANPLGPSTRSYGKPVPTAEWGFNCACERCDGSASVEALAIFDAAHLCPCGCIITPSMSKAVADGVVQHSDRACRCHAHNHVGLGWPGRVCVK